MLKSSLSNYERYLYDVLGLDHANYYKALYNYAFEFFMERKFNEENVFEFKHFLETKRNDKGELLSRYTVNNYLKALKKLGHLEGYNLDSWKLKKTHKPHIQVLEDEEMVRVVNRAYTYDFRRGVATELVLRHGCRISEVTRLPWSEFYGTSIYLKDVKTDNPHEIQILPDLSEKIERLRGNHPYYVFSTSQGNMSRTSYNLFLARILKEEGITKYITAHKLRHSYATSSDGNGVSLKAIQETLGHTDIRTTQHYIHTTQRQLREAAKKSVLANYQMSEQEIREEVAKFILKLNRGGVQAFQVPQNSNLVLTIPFK